MSVGLGCLIALGANMNYSVKPTWAGVGLYTNVLALSDIAQFSEQRHVLGWSAVFENFYLPLSVKKKERKKERKKMHSWETKNYVTWHHHYFSALRKIGDYNIVK